MLRAFWWRPATAPRARSSRNGVGITLAWSGPATYRCPTRRAVTWALDVITFWPTVGQWTANRAVQVQLLHRSNRHLRRIALRNFSRIAAFAVGSSLYPLTCMLAASWQRGGHFRCGEQQAF